MSEKHSSLIFLRRKTSRMIYSRPTSFPKVHGMNNVWLDVYQYLSNCFVGTFQSLLQRNA